MRWMVIGAVVLVAAGCTGGATVKATQAAPETASASARPVAGGCSGTQVVRTGGLPEVRGVAQGAELWGLLFADPPLQHGKEIKIVWRMTGDGPLRASAALPDGTRARLAWGPEEHGGSTWHKPGQEWGTGFVFPKAGCWRIQLTRTSGSGYVDLRVK